MSITNHAELVAAISAWLKRDDLAVQIPDFIVLAEAQIRRDLAKMKPPPRRMETSLSGNFVTSSNKPFTLALPADYAGTKRFQVKSSGSFHALEYRSSESMATCEVTGNPKYFTTNGDYLEIAASPDTTYEYAWTYYAKLPALVDGPNWLIADAPDVYLWRSLLNAAPYLKNDSRINTWSTLYEEAKDALEEANEVERRSGSTLRMRSDAAI